MRRLLYYVQATTTFKPIAVPATGAILVRCHKLLIKVRESSTRLFEGPKYNSRLKTLQRHRRGQPISRHCRLSCLLNLLQTNEQKWCCAAAVHLPALEARDCHLQECALLSVIVSVEC